MEKMASVEETDAEIFPYPGGKARSQVWKFFGFSKKDQQGPATKENLSMDFAICRICKKRYANKGNTTNLAFHLDHHHKGILQPHGETAETTKAPKKASANLVQRKILDVISGAAPLEPRMSESRKAQIDETLMKLIVNKILPLSLVENEHFVNLISLLDPRYQVPGRKLLLEMLEQKMADIKTKIVSELKDTSSISITHDGWTSLNTENYSTVTGHFITKDWELRSVSLETSKLEGSPTSENISEKLSCVQKNWKLPEPIAVTDTTATEKKAIQLLNWTRCGCFGHRVNLVVRNALKEPTISRLVSKGRKLVSFFHQSSSASDLLATKQSQLGLKGYKLIDDVHTRWDSTHAMLERLTEQTASIMAVANDINLSKEVATTIKNNCYDFEELEFSQRVTQVLHPFLMATNSVSLEKEPTMHKMMPILCKLTRILSATEDEPPSIRRMKETMLADLDIGTQDKDVCLLACILNPYTKEMGFLSAEERAHARDLLYREVMEKCIVKIETETAALTSDEPQLAQLPSDISENTTGVVNESPWPKASNTENRDDTSLFSVFGDSGHGDSLAGPSEAKKPKCGVDEWLHDVLFINQTPKPVSDVTSQEVTRYLAADVFDKDRPILEWWKDNELYYPHLSRVAKKYLAVPASSVSSERVFSVCGSVVSKKQARLAAYTSSVEMIVFLNRNMATYW